jgi:DNA-binding NarL/FixJ family response regulator
VNKNPIRVAVADSNRLIRTGLHAVLSSESDFELVGEAESAQHLEALLSSFGADVVLLDFTAPGFNLEAVAALVKRFPDTKMVTITPDQEGTTIINALKAGVVSYIKKDCDFGEIVSSVRETAAGSKFFCGQILNTIRAVDIDVDGENWSNFNCEPVQLSEREQEIITLIAEGFTNTAIAEQLFLSPHTVNTHRKNIMQKLGVKNTAAIVMYAVKTNLVNVNKFLFSAR